MYLKNLSDDAWQLLPDPENRGKDEGWQNSDAPTGAMRVRVPGCIEETFPKSDGVAWYWKTFTARDLPNDHHYRLCFEAADYFAEAWLNGHYLGGNESALLPFHFGISQALREGENHLVVRIVDACYAKMIDGYQLGNVPGGRQHDDPWANGHWHYNYGGLLDDVLVEGRAFQWIRDAFIQPNVAESSIEVDVTLENRSGISGAVTLQAAVCPDFPEKGDAIGLMKIPVELGRGERHVHLTLHLPRVERWDIYNAHLYRLDLSLIRDGQVVDSWTDRFGMREFSLKDGRVCVNGRPVLLRGFLYNQIWPVTLGRPYGGMARRDVELARDAGANLLRMFSKTPFKATLDACDELGVMAHVETLAAWKLWKGPVGARAARLEDLMTRQVRRDRNRASVLWWCCLNETHDELKTIATQQILPKLRALDPTRVLINADNQEPDGCVQWLPTEPEPRQQFRQHHWYILENFSTATPVGYSLSGDMPTRVRTLRGRDILAQPDPATPPVYLSEWGSPHSAEWAELLETYSSHREDLEDAVLYAELEEHHRQQYALLHLDERGFPTFDAFTSHDNRASAKRYEETLSALWGNPRAVGHCLTSFEDSGHELSGVVDIWRRPKVGTYQKIRELNSRCLLNVEWRPRCLYVGEPINLDVTLVNENILPPADYYLSVSLQAPDHSTVWSVQEQVSVTGEPIQPLVAYALKGASIGGPHRLTIILRANASPESRGVAVHVRTISAFDRFPAHPLDIRMATVWEQTPQLSQLLKTVGVPFEWLGSGTDLPESPLMVSAASLKDADPQIWQEVLRRWDSGTPVAFLDHRIFAEADDWMAHFPALDGWKPNPRLLSWDYGGVRFVTNHRIFAGLPQGVAIGATDVYARVCPVDSWQIHERPDSVDCDIAAFHLNSERRDPYTADVCLLTHQGRRMLLSTLNLVGNLNEDPAADRVVLNILHVLSTLG